MMNILLGLEFFERALFVVVGIAGIAGGITALATRSDAFEAAGRQSRTNWALMLFFSALVMVVPFLPVSFLSWVGAVVVGIFWFDVYPQIRNILNGNYEW